MAAAEGHLEVVEALLAAGASVEARGSVGRGPQSRTDATGRTWWEGLATDFRMKLDGVCHLSWR